MKNNNFKNMCICDFTIEYIEKAQEEKERRLKILWLDMATKEIKKINNSIKKELINYFDTIQHGKRINKNTLETIKNNIEKKREYYSELWIKE